jgi:tetratricopeptide (TPR) repeat protein
MKSKNSKSESPSKSPEPSVTTAEFVTYVLTGVALIFFPPSSPVFWIGCLFLLPYGLLFAGAILALAQQYRLAELSFALSIPLLKPFSWLKGPAVSMIRAECELASLRLQRYSPDRDLITPLLRALKLAHKFSAPADLIAGCYVSLSAALVAAERHEESLDAAEKALSLLELTQVKQSQTAALHNMSASLIKLGHLDQAKRVAQLALSTLQQELADKSQQLSTYQKESLCTAWNNLGCVYDLENDWPKAESAFRNALDIRQTCPDKPDSVLLARYNLAYALASGGKLAEAEIIVNDLAQGKLDRSASIRTACLTLSGDIALKRGKVEAAEIALLKALEASGAAETGMAAYLYSMLGVLHETKSNAAEAEHWYAESIKALEKLGSNVHPQLIKPITLLRDFLLKLGRLEDAEVQTARLQAIAKAHGLEVTLLIP